MPVGRRAIRTEERIKTDPASNDVTSVKDISEHGGTHSDVTIVKEFVEHRACWMLEKRGSVGETLLHLAMLFADDDTFSDIVRTLLGVYPRLALDFYEGDEYYGKV